MLSIYVHMWNAAILRSPVIKSTIATPFDKNECNDDVSEPLMGY